MIGENTRKVDLMRATYGEVKQQSYDLAVLPWGATEPHNYHLPYSTDCYLSQSIALDAALKAEKEGNVKCMVLPPVPFGAQNIGQWQLPFCLHTRYETQKAILSDIVSSLYRQGLRRLVIVNGHGGNSFKNMVRDLGYDYPDFLIAVSDWYAFVPEKEYFEESGEHAGEQETSVLMYYHPELVNMSMAGDGDNIPFAIEELNRKTAWIPRNWARVTKDTGIGNPFKSTPEKGKRYAEEVVKRLSALFIDLIKKESIY